MKKKSAAFSNAECGDKVYSLKYGYGTIADISKGTFATYPISCDFKDGEACFTVKGFSSIEDKEPDLYWGKPNIIAPPEPKRLVTVRKNVFLNLYDDKTHIFFTKPDAIYDSGITTKNVAVPAKLTYKIEK